MTQPADRFPSPPPSVVSAHGVGHLNAVRPSTVAERLNNLADSAHRYANEIEMRLAEALGPVPPAVTEAWPDGPGWAGNLEGSLMALRSRLEAIALRMGELG